MRWLLTRGRFPVLALIVVLTAWLGWHAARVGVEHDNASLNTSDPEATARYAAFQETFGSDEDMLVAVTSPALLAPDGLRLVDRLTRDMAALDGVAYVFSLTTARRLVPSPDGPVDAPLLPALDTPDLEARARAALDQNPEYTGVLVSADRRTAGFLVEIAVRPGDEQYRSAIITAIRGMGAAAAAAGAELHLTGITVQKHDVSTYVTRDQAVLLPLAILVLAVTLWWFFRRPLGVILPLAVTGVTVAWTLGAYGLAGREVNPITALLPPVLMVLSLAVSVHIIKGWLDAPPAHDRADRIRHVVGRLLFPCFFCSLTTVIGFASLLTSDLPAVRDFGLFAALGVATSFVVGMTLVPIGLTWLEPPAAPPTERPHRLMHALLQWSATTAIARPWTVLGIATVLTVASLVAIPHIKNNTDLVRFLKPDAPLYRDTLFLDTHLTGTSTLDFVVTRADGRPLTRADDVARLARLEQSILTEPPVTSVTSILGVLRQIERAQDGRARLALPEGPEDTAAAFDLMAAAGDEPIVRKLASPDFRQARLNVHLHAVGTAVAAPLAERVLATGRSLLGPAYRLEATGAFYHVARDSNRLVESQVNSFGLALVLVFVAIGVLFRSVAITVVAMIPNVVPIAWTGGLMAVAGIDLSSGTAMIASAVIGLVVDDTIHYLTDYRRSYRGDPAAAALHTSTGIGTALFMNNLILVLGFWVGCFGSFKPTIYFALLSGLTMLTAMFCDLLITPACLVALDRRGWRIVAAAAVGLALLVGRPAVTHADDDRLVTWTAVPDETRRVGEVRLVDRDGRAVVQTLLHTSLLGRVVAEIRRKEMTNWPDGTTGHADAVRYVEALERTRAELDDQRDPDAGDRRQRLLIEFVLGDGAAEVILGDYDAGAAEGPVQLGARRPRHVLPDLSRDYVRRNMGYIVADAFDVDPAAIDSVLGPLAPRLRATP